MTPPSIIVSQLALFAFKASLVFGAAFLITTLMRRAAAATRHVVWLSAFVGVVALPFAGAVLPSLNVPLLSALRVTDRRQDARAPTAPEMAVAIARPRLAGAPFTYEMVAIAPSADVAPARAVAGGVSVGVGRSVAVYEIPAPSASPVSPAWSLRLVLLWLFGSVMVAVAFAVGVLRTYILSCQATPAIGDALADEAEVLAASLGIVRDVRVMTWEGPTMPMTWGALRPVVLLPESARLWPAARRQEVLTHELAHVSRGDWAVRLLAALVCAVQWFNPLAWLAARRMRDEQELACDDAVLAGGAQASAYAAHLLDVARSLRSPAFGITSASVAMARPSQLTGRLLAMLDSSRSRGPARASLALVWLLAAVVVVPVAAMTDTGDRIPDTEGRRPVEVRVPANMMAAVAAPRAPLAPTVANAPTALTASTASTVCDLNGRRGRDSNSSHSHSDSDGGPNFVTLSISQNGCLIEVRIRGKVTFNDGEDDVAEVPQGGSVRVSEESDGVEKRFEISWQGGRLQRRWYLDGHEVPETADQRAWLSWALQQAFTRTGYNAIPRALRAYRAGGLDSALKLADASGSDYMRRMIATALIDSVHVPPAEAARVAMLAQNMSSDYDRAELLILVAQKMRLDGAVQDAMVSVAGQMSSDYDRGRVLSAALARPDLSAQATAGLLRVAGQMSSDYEKAELLIRYLGARPFDEARRAPFFLAANSISSDYDKRRLLSVVVTRVSAAGPVISDVTAASANISSDYERAELLIQIGQKFRTNADVRTQIMRASSSFSSDYERGRVVAALGRIPDGRYCIVDGTPTAC